jgi:hypothetical protein
VLAWAAAREMAPVRRRVVKCMVDWWVGKS